MRTQIPDTYRDHLRTLHDRLARWEAASLISHDEAAAIERFELERSTGFALTPLVVEALAYLGGALALAATIVVLADRWNDLAAGTRVAVMAGGSLICLVSGLLLRRSREPAIDRLTGVLWGVAVGLAGWCGWLVAYDVLDMRGRPPSAIGGATAAALGAVLYALRRRTIQQLALLIGLFVALTAAVESPFSQGLITSAIGGTWVTLGWREIVTPRRAALAFGAAAAFVGITSIGQDERAIAFALALTVAVALIVASVLLRESIMLALGVLGLFVSSIHTIGHYFEGSIAMPIALVAAGAVAFAAALVLARRTRPGHHRG